MEIKLYNFLKSLLWRDVFISFGMNKKRLFHSIIKNGLFKTIDKKTVD